MSRSTQYAFSHTGSPCLIVAICSGEMVAKRHSC